MEVWPIQLNCFGLFSTNYSFNRSVLTVKHYGMLLAVVVYATVITGSCSIVHWLEMMEHIEDYEAEAQHLENFLFNL